MHTVEEARTRIEKEYGENAKYILNCYEVRDALEGVERSIKNENALLIDHYFDSAKLIPCINSPYHVTHALEYRY